MIKHGAPVVVLVLTVSPATAAPYPAPNAVAELRAARQATNSASNYQFRDNLSGDTAYYEAGGRYEQSRNRQIIIDGQGNHHLIAWPSQRVRTIAGVYLGNPSAQWELCTTAGNYNLPLWADIRDQGYLLNGDRVLRDGYVEDLFPVLPTEFDKQTDGFTTVYRTGSSTYTVDAAGRITRIVSPGVDRSWTYAAVDVRNPDPATVEPIDRVRTAIQAATLNSTLRQVARTAITHANQARGTLAQLRKAAAKIVADRNRVGDGDDESPISRRVPLRSKGIPGGVKVFSKNPFTHKTVLYRITRGSHDDWRMRRG